MPAGLMEQAPEALRWQMKRVAAEERSTVRALLTRILTEWLSEHGYAPAATTEGGKELQHG